MTTQPYYCKSYTQAASVNRCPPDKAEAVPSSAGILHIMAAVKCVVAARAMPRIGSQAQRNQDEDSPTCLETPVEPTFVTILKMNQDGGRMKKNT